MIKKSLTAAVATAVFATGIHGAELKGGNAWQLANGDLVFGGRTGGLSARFLAFEEWDADNNSISDRDWAIDSLIEHDGEVWWAETDPVLADEPGVAAAWVQVSGAIGPVGPPGADGAVGATGPAGADGTDGAGTALSNADPETVIGSGGSAGTGTNASRGDHQHHLNDGAVTAAKYSDASINTSKIADNAITAGKIPNQEISHIKLGSSVGGINQAAGRIQEADGAGGMRWSNKGGGSGDALSSAALPTPDSTNAYDVVDNFGQLYANIPETIGQSVTWTASGDGVDVSSLWGESSGTYRFRGITATSGVSSPQSGDVVLLPNGGFRHRGATRWAHLSNPLGWVGGPYANEDEADSHATALNDVSAYDDSLQLVTTFTAGTIHYQWTNIVANAPPSALVSRVLGIPTADRLYEIQNFLGELYKVEPRPTGHIVTWDDYVSLSDVSALWGESAGTYRWRGETYPSGVTNPATGDVIKEPAGHFRHRNSSNAWVHLVDPSNFIGDYNDETAADNHVTAVGETSLYSHNLHQVATFTAGVATYVWAKGLDAREVIADAHAFGGNLATTDTNLQLIADKVDGLILGPSISDDAPEDVGDTTDAGTGAEVSADDHAHRLPIDNTLAFNSSDELAVNVQDVIEHLQERIRYFTSSTNYSSDAGASVGQAYDTSQYRKLITKVEVNFDPLVGADSFLVRLVELESNNEIKAKLFTSNTRRGPFGAGSGVRAFTFHDAAGDVGVPIDGGIRLGILLSRLEDDSDSAVGALHGSEASGSPNETYNDASDDFDLDNGIVYQHIDPAVGASTHSHDTQIRGNIKIFYTLILDHGQLVGDGNVNIDHLDSGSQAAERIIETDGAEGFRYVDKPAGGNPFATNNPADIDDTADPGAGTTVAHANHVHRLQTDTSLEFTAAGVLGTTSSGGGGAAPPAGGGYSAWENIGSRSGAISGPPVTVTLDTDETIDDYEELYIHIQANDANDASSTSHRIRVSDIPETTLAGGGINIGFPGPATDEGALLVRRNVDGDSLVLDPHSGGPTFPATAVTIIYARVLTADEAGGLPDFFTAHMSVTPSTTLSATTSANKTNITASDIITNRGGFTVEPGTNSQNAIQVGNDGTYLIEFNVHVVDDAGSTTGRAQIQGDIIIMRAGVDLTNFTARTSMYWRGQDDTDEIYISGTHTVDMQADDQIEVRFSTAGTETISWIIGGGESEISVVKIEAGGGGTTAGQQAAAGRTLVQRNIVTARQAQAEFSLGTEWTNVDGTSPTFTAIPKADFDRMEVGFWVNSSFVYPVVLTRAMATAMGPISNPLPTGLVDADDIHGAFLTFRTIAGADSREPILLNPRYGFMEARRMANRCGIFIHMNDNSDDDWAQVGFHYSCEEQIDLEYVRAYFYEDAS